MPGALRGRRGPDDPYLQRDNVLFGGEFDEDRYWSVVERSCLLPDLAQLPDGDLTEVIYI